MAFDYDDIAETAKDLIEDFGGPITLRRIGETTPDPAKPWEKKPGTIESFSLRGVKSNYRPQLVDGTRIKAFDQRLILPAEGLDLDPAETYEADIAGETWRVLDISRSQPGETILTYFLQLRR